MADGLKKLLGLGNVERGSESGGGESSQDLSRFKSEFKKLIEEVNRDLGSIAPILGEDRQRDLSARRDKTYAAYQLAVTAIGTGGAEESTSGDLADRVLASVRTLQAMVAKVKESANQEREAWGDCDNRIEAAQESIHDLHDAGIDKASAFQNALDAIGSKATNRQYKDAVIGAGVLLDKLDGYYDSVASPSSLEDSNGSGNEEFLKEIKSLEQEFQEIATELSLD